MPRGGRWSAPTEVVSRHTRVASDFAHPLVSSALGERSGDTHPRLTHRALGRRLAMIKMLMRMIGAPVVRRARGLAQAFLDQTRTAGDVQRDLLLGRAGAACRQPVRP